MYYPAVDDVHIPSKVDGKDVVVVGDAEQVGVAGFVRNTSVVDLQAL